mmetsp:Transcript_850/g.1972  ORF Transcript_850/g.1972 Transcript_850/m.1972 type:complete len:266 (+) Transcript_850:68-865(+)
MMGLLNYIFRDIIIPMPKVHFRIDLFKITFLCIVARPDATKGISIQLVFVLRRHFQTAVNILLLGVDIRIHRRRLFPLLGGRNRCRTAFPQHFQCQFGTGPAKEYLLFDGNPGKGKVFFSNDDQLALHPLVLGKALLGNLAQALVAWKLGGSPFLGRLFRQANGLEWFNRISRVSSRRIDGPPLDGIQIDLKGDFSPGDILVARDFVSNHQVSMVGDIDHFVSVDAVFSDPQSIKIELGQTTSSCRSNHAVFHGILVSALAFRLL